MGAKHGNIKMFADIHRFLQQRHQDIEWLKGLHRHKDSLRKEGVHEAIRALEHDTSERISQIDKFSEDLQKFTNRKVEALQKELMDHETRMKNKESQVSAADKKKMQFQIDRISANIDSMWGGLCTVADAMDVMHGNCPPDAVSHR